jgi:hypothetical protein
VVSALQNNLSRKARGYENEAVAAIFLMNNYTYMAK